jgi:hypothetical protein
MEIRIGIAKTAKRNADESADTVLIVERPTGGGYSVILCNGTINGQDSKNVSFLSGNKISSLISEGVRDSTAIRATSDHLFTTYSGQAQSELNVVSVDLITSTIVSAGILSSGQMTVSQSVFPSISSPRSLK